MSELKYDIKTNQIKPFLFHKEFKEKFKPTAIAEKAFNEWQEYNLQIAYSDIYAGCLIAGSIAEQIIEKQAKIIELLKKSNEFYVNFNNWDEVGCEIPIDGSIVCDSDLEDIQCDENKYVKLGGKLARQIKKEVEEVENE